jgi:prepilin peptidase CpaA
MFDGVNLPIVMAVAGAGLTSALIDMRTRRVPNPLTLGIAAAGVALAIVDRSGLSVPGALAGLGVGLALMLPGYLIGATGGGDVKLFAATGTLIGPRLMLFAFLYTLLAGGLLALVVAWRRRSVARTIARTAELVRTVGGNAREIEQSATDNRFAYAPAIAIGTLVAALGI